MKQTHLYIVLALVIFMLFVAPNHAQRAYRQPTGVLSTVFDMFTPVTKLEDVAPKASRMGLGGFFW